MVRGCGGANHDVRAAEARLPIAEPHGPPADAARNRFGALEAAVGDDHGGSPPGDQAAGDKFPSLAGAEDDHFAALEPLEEFARKVDGNRTDRGMPAGDSCSCADILGGAECRLEKGVDRAVGRTAIDRSRVGLLELPEDFGFAGDHRFQPAGDTEKVACGFGGCFGDERNLQPAGNFTKQ